MVECKVSIDDVFRALGDETRRDILVRVARHELSIGELASPYQLSFAAVAKHVAVLEKAQLIQKRREGKEQIVTLVPATLAHAHKNIEKIERLWSERFRALDELLSK